MRSVIVVHPNFDTTWPWAGDHFHALWKAQGTVEFIRQQPGDTTPVSQVVRDPALVTRLVVLGSVVTPACVAAFNGLREAAIIGSYGAQDVSKQFAARGVKQHFDEGSIAAAQRAVASG